MGRIGNFKSYIRSRDFLDANYDDPKIGCLYLCTSAMLSSEFHFFNEAEHIVERIENTHAQYFDRRILQSLTILKFKHAQVLTKKDSMRMYLKDLRGEYYRIIEKNMDAT